MLRVTCAIIEDNNKVLCAQRSQQMNLPLKWEFPGGKVEDNEQFENCLKREIKEELGVTINILEKLPANRHNYAGKLIELIPFRCELSTFQIELREHSQIKWLPIEQLLVLDWAEADIPIVKNYIQKYQ